MIGIIQRFGMAIELSHRKITVFLLYHQNSFVKNGIDVSVVDLTVIVRLYLRT